MGILRGRLAAGRGRADHPHHGRDRGTVHLPGRSVAPGPRPARRRRLGARLVHRVRSRGPRVLLLLQARDRALTAAGRPAPPRFPRPAMPRHCPALLLALLAATAPRADGAPEPPKEFDPKAIDAYLAKQVAENGHVGLSVAVVRDGKVVLARGYGKRSLKPEAP